MSENKGSTVERRSWEEFRAAQLLWWVNRMLHLFGWAIVCIVEEGTGKVLDVYPARVKFRGFDLKSEEEGFVGLSSYLSENARKLHAEASPCPECAPEHQGVWDGKRYQVCPVCHDSGAVDAKAREILEARKCSAPLDTSVKGERGRGCDHILGDCVDDGRTVRASEMRPGLSVMFHRHCPDCGAKVER